MTCTKPEFFFDFRVIIFWILLVAFFFILSMGLEDTGGTVSNFNISSSALQSIDCLRSIRICWCFRFRSAQGLSAKGLVHFRILLKSAVHSLTPHNSATLCSFDHPICLCQRNVRVGDDIFYCFVVRVACGACLHTEGGVFDSARGA